MGKSDVIVTTALVPGRPAPKLIPAAAVALMKPGSVIVDLAGRGGRQLRARQAGGDLHDRQRREDRRRR